MDEILAIRRWAVPGRSALADEHAFSALVEVWRVWGYRLALKVTGCPDSASDAVQEAVIRAFRSRSEIRELSLADAWFRKIVLRCALAQRPVAPLSVPLDTRGLETDVVEQLHVRRTLARLKPADRAILALSLGEGLSYAEIGRLLDIPEGTVGSRLAKARATFRRFWGENR